MDVSRYHRGLTLLEMLVVVSIVAALMGMVIVVTHRVEGQSQENMLANTFAILESALGQFYEYEFQYSPTDQRKGYAELRFPLDCSDYSLATLQTTLANVLGAGTVVVTNHNEATEMNPARKLEYLQYSGCEVMYFFLSQVPEARRALSGVSAGLVTNKNMYGNGIQIAVNGRPPQPLLRVVDPWGTTLRYDYYEEQSQDVAVWARTKRSFPVLTSAGPDRQFGTADDISSKSR
ncbi:MAG: prepilin-type N-terminal cleavage/methylation domain-containing protein [Sedimentisphaerales bacterium]|nr:prepilin-type N-terminal cleavage/methylation domain-containing protein [Sedimentisphaerales bacterium]